MAATLGGRAAEGAIAEPDAEVIVGIEGEVIAGPGAGAVGDAGGGAAGESNPRTGTLGFGGTRAGTT